MLKLIIFLSLFLLLSCSTEKSNSPKTSSEPTQETEDIRREQKNYANESEEENFENDLNQNLSEQKYGVEETTDLQEIHFTELWIWDYLNEDKEWEELWVYREPNLNYWLFERLSSFGMTSEMCEWVMAKPNGEYWFSYQAPEMNTPNTLQQQQIEFDKTESFSEFWKPTGTKKEFGDPAHGWPNFIGEEYEVFYKGQPDPSNYYLAQGDIDMTALYYFNFLEGDIQLPISFPTDIPKNVIVLSEKTDLEFYDINVHYSFKEISPNSYYVYLPL